MSSLIDRDWLKNIVHGMILLILASTIISILTMTISAIPDESMSVDIDGDGNTDFNMKVVLQLMSVFVPIAIIVTALNKLGVRF